jgi:hypothetical protein
MIVELGFSEMRALIILVVIGALCATDRLAFGGRYSSAVWADAQYRGQLFSYDVKQWLRAKGLL